VQGAEGRGSAQGPERVSHMDHPEAAARCAWGWWPRSRCTGLHGCGGNGDAVALKRCSLTHDFSNSPEMMLAQSCPWHFGTGTEGFHYSDAAFISGILMLHLCRLHLLVHGPTTDDF